MATLKAHLKSAREAISSKDWQRAENAAEKALELDKQSYNAYVFLGLSQLNLGKVSLSETSYRAAIELDPFQPLAWQGLASLYEKQDKIDDYIDTLEHQAEIWNNKGEAVKLGETLLKLISLPGKSRKQTIAALSLVLIDSPFYALLSTLPEPDPTSPKSSALHPLQTILSNSLPTLREVVALTKAEDTEAVSREISKRRTRLTSLLKTAAQTKAEVIAEFYPTSQLPNLWQQVLDHPFADDQTRREIELELLDFYLDWLESLPCPLLDQNSSDQGASNKSAILNNTDTIKKRQAKDEIRNKIETLARGQVILKITNQKAWDIVLDWGEILGPSQSEDPNGYLESLPDVMTNSALANLILAFKQINMSRVADDPQDFEDLLEQVDTSFTSIQDHSILSHVLTASIYQQLDEWQTVVKVAESGLVILAKLEKMIGKRLFIAKRRLKTYLALALTYYNPPSQHLRAIKYIDEVLCDEPSNSFILTAKACVFKHSRSWQLAYEFYSRALEESLNHPPIKILEIRSEQAWCLLELGRTNLAIQNFQTVIQGFEDLPNSSTNHNEISHNLAENWYRLGRCHWLLGQTGSESSQLTSVEQSEAKQAAYSCFIKSIKSDTFMASPFTYLGLYYADQNDYTRSSKCFQKAFELDPTQDIAAFKLASEFADAREWDLVEVAAKRLISGGDMQMGSSTKANGFSNSSRLASFQQHAWAWKALGAVELSKGKFTEALSTFQLAIRSSPNDWHIWVKMGLAYQGTGKHHAALRSFIKARELIDEEKKISQPPDSQSSSNWYVDFCIANAQRRIGLLEPAVKLFEKVVINRPLDAGAEIILAETKFDLALLHSQKGKFNEAENDLIDCLDIVRQLAGGNGSRVSAKAAWKLAGDVFGEFAQWNRCIPIETFNVDSKPNNINEKLKLNLSFFINLAAKMNVDNVLGEIKSVTCLETSAIASENGSSGLFFLASIVAFKVRVILEIPDSCYFNVAQAWADLATSLGKLSRWLEVTSRKSLLSDPSTFFKTQAGPEATLAEGIKCIKTALQHQSSNTGFWNILGVLLFNLNPKLSQHAFIKSVELDSKNHNAWTNLGFFYLSHSDLQLSRQAFVISQTMEPECPLAWLGQALIAALSKNYENSQELVEQSYSLSMGSNNAIESCYATMALKMITKAVPGSCSDDVLAAPMMAANRLLKKNPNDPSVLNLHALISEVQGNLDEAIVSLEKSAQILEGVFEVTESGVIEQRYLLTNLNLGRIRLRNGDNEAAIAAMETVLSLRPHFDKDTDAIETASQTVIIRAQAASSIALARHFMEDSLGCLEGLDAALSEVREMRDDASVGVSQLWPHVCALSLLKAKVLWSQADKPQRICAGDLLTEIISITPTEAAINFDIISFLMAMIIVEETDDQLQHIITTALLDKQQKTREDITTINSCDVEKTTHEAGTPPTQSESDEVLFDQLVDLLDENCHPLARNPKAETNTILKLFEHCSHATVTLPSDSSQSFQKSYKQVGRILQTCWAKVRETEQEVKERRQNKLIKISNAASSTELNKELRAEKLRQALCLAEQLNP
ncbi:hypothetical protein O181_026741 [Austropuccinia psidii MF-1]|uniref:Superkiller protein 3 n=1 Tax=Austropuccinia psidii MF-1 TaxID=1389203 RepID=A0A9Q3CR26_9BASI|nr:hypothetical protein [Austropuccinia psidii MF-1]